MPGEGTRSLFASQSEDEISYEIGLISTDFDSVERLYNNINNAKYSLSPVGKVETKDAFVARLFSNSGVFLSISSGGEEVGVAYAIDIVPGYSANFNFIFWDRRTKGRQKLVLAILRWLSNEFLIRRFEIHYHALAFYALGRIYRIGAFYEGTKRKAWRYEDKIIDLHIFSILTSELTNEVLSKGYIPRKPTETRWYKQLTHTNRRD